MNEDKEEDGSNGSNSSFDFDIDNDNWIPSAPPYQKNPNIRTDGPESLNGLSPLELRAMSVAAKEMGLQEQPLPYTMLWTHVIALQSLTEEIRFCHPLEPELLLEVNRDRLIQTFTSSLRDVVRGCALAARVELHLHHDGPHHHNWYHLYLTSHPLPTLLKQIDEENPKCIQIAEEDYSDRLRTVLRLLVISINRGIAGAPQIEQQVIQERKERALRLRNSSK